VGEYAAHEGALDARGMRFGVVAARFNRHVTEPLLEGALRVLTEHGADERDLVVAWVPGSFEIPLAAKRLAESGAVDAVICLGAVIRGDTAHFDYVAGGAAEGILRTALDASIPVVFGVLTTDTLQQALDRVGGSEGHKGEEAALTAIEMVDLLRALPSRPAEG
jgi:6,7-dimethyl-8-ribityllumazine synthase